jgi:hypothetical protein
MQLYYHFITTILLCCAKHIKVSENVYALNILCTRVGALLLDLNGGQELLTSWLIFCKQLTVICSSSTYDTVCMYLEHVVGRVIGTYACDTNFPIVRMYIYTYS